MLTLEPPFSKCTILGPLNCQPVVCGWRRRLRRVPPDGMTTQIEREGDANQGRAALSLRGGFN